MAATATHTVQKMQRGINGRWFFYRAHRIADMAEARKFAQEFANDQRDVGGTKILLDGVCVRPEVQS